MPSKRKRSGAQQRRHQGRDLKRCQPPVWTCPKSLPTPRPSQATWCLVNRRRLDRTSAGFKGPPPYLLPNTLDGKNRHHTVDCFAMPFVSSNVKTFNALWFFLGSGGYGASSITTPDMEDVKESVRQGVTKVAGKLSGMASGVMTQLQVKFG